MTSRKNGSEKKSDEPEKAAEAPESSTAAVGKKICAYEGCERPVWGKHGEEEFCLFHSEKLEEKKAEFKEEIEKFKGGETEQFLRKGREGEE